MATDVNLNSAECITSATGFGETIYHNICTGATHTVAWGSMDYVGAILLIVLALMLALGLIGFVKMLFSDF